MPKKPDNRTHAQRRRAETRDALRLKMKGAEYIQQIAKDYTELTALDKSVKSARGAANVAIATEKAKTRVQIIKLKMDTNFRRLNKVLPDLKAIELVAPDEDGEVKPIQVVINAVDAGAN